MRWTALSPKEQNLVERVNDLWHGPLAEIATEAREADHLDGRMIDALAGAGLFGVNVAREFGGEALDIGFGTAQCVIREAIAYHSPDADVIITLQGFGTALLTLLGSSQQQSELLADLVTGRQVFAFALTEPRGGSDVLAMGTRARQDGDSWILDGEKMFISGAPDANVYVVFARTSEAERGLGISAFLVRRGTPGFTLERGPQLAAPHAIGRLHFDHCVVPRTDLLGEPGGGLVAAMGNLEMFRPSVGALAIGVGHRARDLALEFAQQRELFGKRLIDQPRVQATLAEMWLKLEASREFVMRAARLGDAGHRGGHQASAAKLYATEAASWVVKEAQQIHGGRGVTRGYEVESLARTIRPTTIYEGASDVQRMIIGRAEMRRTDHAVGAPEPDAFGSTPEFPGDLLAALPLLVAARSVYQGILVELSSGAYGKDGSVVGRLIPYEIADMLLAIDAAELVWQEAAHRHVEGAPTAASLGIGALVLAADAVESVESGALTLHHDFGLSSRASLAELAEARYRTHAESGSRLSCVARLAEGLLSVAEASL